MSEAPRQIQQNAGETRARGTATDAVEHFRALPRRAEEEQNRHQPALKVAVLPWRFCPPFLGVMRWRTKDAPDCAMRCRLAPSKSARTCCTTFGGSRFRSSDARVFSGGSRDSRNIRSI